MYVLCARIRTRPGEADAYEALLAGAVEALSREPCFVRFSIGRSLTDPDEFLLHEAWTDRDSYERLRQGPVFEDYLARRADHVASVSRSDWSLLRETEAARPA